MQCVMSGVQGVQPAKPAPLTIPQSPAFALKRTTRAAAAVASMIKEQDQVCQLSSSAVIIN